MMVLTKDMQETIAKQMCLKARDVDVCVFNALDNALPKDLLLDSLMLYRNKDGGFGNGLHIDNYNPNTSVYQIYEAFRLMDILDFDSNCDNELFIDIVNKACNYLYNREVPQNNKWNANTKTNNDYAHSKEFDYNESNEKLYGYHPTMAILVYTLLFNKETKAYYKKALKMASILIDEFLIKEDVTDLELVSFNSFLNSIKKLNLFTDKQDLIEAKLIKLAEERIGLDFENQDNKNPLDLALYVSSAKIDEYKNKQLDFIISSIAFHGLWDHKKTWGYDKYAEEDSALIKWVGAESVNNYFLLKKYGRIE